MKSYLISDNKDTWVGMRLAGINGVIVHNREDALKEIREKIEDKSIGIIILTEKIVDLTKDEVMELKLKCNKPLIIEIPGPKGSIRETNQINNYIKNSVGIRIWGD